MKITDENNGLVGRYCGELSGKEVFAGGVYALLAFHSDSAVRKRGYLIVITAVQPSKFNKNAPDK